MLVKLLSNRKIQKVNKKLINLHKQKLRHKLKAKILKTLKLVMNHILRGVEIKEDVVVEILSKNYIF